MANAIVVVGASSGGLSPLRRITESLPHNCKVTVFVVVHVGKFRNSVPEILSWNGRLPVSLGADGALIEPGHIYVAPSDQHMLVTTDNIQLSQAAAPGMPQAAIEANTLERLPIEMIARRVTEFCSRA
jgi:two-component system, chemotaxis family, protein-glutamate methylesterase/glutaminase